MSNECMSAPNPPHSPMYTSNSSTAQSLIQAAKTLNQSLKDLRFSSPVSTVYLPTEYAWAPHSTYLQRFGNSKKRILFLGMNPGPWGMAQTGIPFGEIPAVRDWMKIEEPVEKPAIEHPKRPIEGFNCTRSEVSGRRLWGLFSDEFPDAESFFAEHFVANYCPLVWMGETGKNITPNHLPKSEMEPVEEACQIHLASIIRALKPDWLIGVGAYAEKKLSTVVKNSFPHLATKSSDFLPLEPPIKIGKILHPSPASPIANRGWAQQAKQQLIDMGAWT